MTQILVPKRRLYLAYGSNLHKGDMRQRCPGAKPAGVVWLDNARLVFRGVADVECIPGYRVPCGMWSITPQNEASLDRYEGVAGGFYTKELVDLGEGREALIYMMTAQGIYPPSQYYVDTLRQGYKDFGLPMKYLNAAIFHSFKGKDPCEQTIARRQRQKQSSHQQRLVPMPESLARKRLEQRLERARQMQLPIGSDAQPLTTESK